ncbi:TPA: phage tail tape measure protein [Pseudomonas aeruginosa]
MAEESRLSIIIDSRGAEKNATSLSDALDRVERSGDEAAGSTSRLSEVTVRLGSNMSKAAAATVASLSRIERATESTSSQMTALVSRAVALENAMSSVGQGIGRLDTGITQSNAQLGQLNAQMSHLVSTFSTFSQGQSAINAQLSRIAANMSRAADETQNLDQSTSRAGRGAREAASDLDAERAGLARLLGQINPTVAALDRLDDMQQRLTAGQLSVFAQQVGAGNATVAQAASALTQLAGAGNQLTILYPKIAAAAISWSKVTDQSVEDVVGSFNDLAKNPVDAVKKLDDQLNFLTASQYANIQSLQEQGRTMDAARIATDAYANALASRSTEMEQNLGVVEQAWNGLKSAAKSAWDAMLDIGRTESPEQQLQKVYKQIENAQKGIGRGGRAAFGLGISQPSLDALYKRAADLQAKIAADGAKNLEQATNNAIQAAGKKGIDLINSTYKSSLTQIQRLQQEMDALDKGRLAAQKAGALSAEEEAKFAKGRKNIEQQIADIKEREAKKSAPKARGQNVGVREADNTASRLLAQYDPAGQAVRTLTKEETQLQLALSRGKITREEYSKALAQASLNYAAAIKGAQGLTAAEQYQAQLERQLLLQREQYAAQAAAVGMGGLEAERYQQRIQLEQQSNDRVLQLQTELAQATTEKQRQELQAQIDLEREYLPKRIQAQKDGYQQMDKARQDWLAGAASGARTWFEQIDDTASQTRSAMMRGLDGLNDELHTFVTTGKASFRSLTTSVLSDLARIAQNKFITSLISSMSGSSNGVISAIGSYFTANAKGGVYSSPSLSAFSNGVYNSPQFFAFAKGAGVFGEAGPEAIMPLTRAADGSLGVRAVGSGGAKSAGGNTFQINTNVTVTAGTTSQSVTSDTNDNYAMQLSKMIADVARGVIAQESQPGGIIWRMQNGR